MNVRRANVLASSADSERYGAALTDACAAWLIYTLAGTLQLALDAGSTVAQTGTRQLILGRLHAFVQVSTLHAHLPATRDVARQALDILTTRWPDAPR